MNELTPELALSIQTLRWHVAEQEASIQRNRTAVLELVARQAKNDTNIAAARKYVEQLTAQDGATPLEKQRRKVDIANQQSTVERQILENLEGAERVRKHTETIEAAMKAKEGFQKNLASMEAAHGTLTEEDYVRLQNALCTR